MPDAANSSGNLLQVLFGLLLVLGLMGASAWLLKRYGPQRIGGTLDVKVVGGINLGNRERVLVLEVADQWIVVGVTAASMNTLTTLPRQELEPGMGPLAPGGSFAAWLKQTMERGPSSDDK